ncbi:MAG: metal-dependent hydrolase [Myxococcota bacterium]
MSWALGSTLPERRDRRLVAWSGVSPDVDGVSLLWGVDAYDRWHHVLTHGVVAAAFAAALAGAFARDRGRVAVLAFAAFHLHLACDLVGSGVGWTLTYFYPLSRHEFGIDWGWELSSWQNLAITLALLGFSLRTAVLHERSFVETWMPAFADAAFCALVRRTWRRIATRLANRS